MIPACVAVALVCSSLAILDYAFGIGLPSATLCAASTLALGLCIGWGASGKKGGVR